MSFFNELVLRLIQIVSSWPDAPECAAIQPEVYYIKTAKHRLLTFLLFVLVVCGVTLVTLATDEQTLEDLVGSAWDAEALFHQPRMQVYTERAEQYGYHPRTTAWHAVPGDRSDVVTRLLNKHIVRATPGKLMMTFASDEIGFSLGQDTWEITTRVHVDEDLATGAVLIWGFKDDAVIGQDYRLIMRQHGAGWYVFELEERFHCARGVAGNLCL